LVYSFKKFCHIEAACDEETFDKALDGALLSITGKNPLEKEKESVTLHRRKRVKKNINSNL
jgi:hypothetical protein